MSDTETITILFHILVINLQSYMLRIDHVEDSLHVSVGPMHVP